MILRAVLLVPVLMCLAAAPATRPATEESSELQQLRRQYAERRQEIGKELRRRNVGLGGGSPGDLNGISARTSSLRELLETQREMRRNATDAKAALDDAVELLGRGGELPFINVEISRDPRVRDLRERLAKLQKERLAQDAAPRDALDLRIADLRKQADDAAAEVRAKATQMAMTQLRQQHELTAAQLAAIDEKIPSAAADVERAVEQALQRESLRAELQLLDDVLRELDRQIAESRK